MPSAGIPVVVINCPVTASRHLWSEILCTGITPGSFHFNAKALFDITLNTVASPIKHVRLNNINIPRSGSGTGAGAGAGAKPTVKGHIKGMSTGAKV